MQLKKQDDRNGNFYKKEKETNTHEEENSNKNLNCQMAAQ